MVIFHSYVKLPEGNSSFLNPKSSPQNSSPNRSLGKTRTVLQTLQNVRRQNLLQPIGRLQGRYAQPQQANEKWRLMMGYTPKNVSFEWETEDKWI